MIDHAGIEMAQGYSIAGERVEGVNDNMVFSHYHDFYELYYLESGQRFHFYKDELYEIEGGQFVLFPPYVMHRSYGTEGIAFKRIVLYFRPGEIASEELANALHDSGGVYRFDDKPRRKIHALLESLITLQRTDAFNNELSKSLLNVLLISILRHGKLQKKTTQYSRIEQVIHYIHDNYQQDLSLELLSKQFYISPYHLCHEFKRYTNRTIIEYLNVTRIMQAQRKLMETNHTITEICHQTGFKNLTHFNRVFRTITNMTPSQYRKSGKSISFDTTSNG